MRSFNRFSTDEEVAVVIDGEQGAATLYNLSSGGCMIELADGSARRGARVEIELLDQLTVRGSVVWRIGDKAGIEFAPLLHRTVVEELGYVADEEPFDADDPRDRFGLPLLG